MFESVNQYCLNRIVKLSESRAVVATEDIVEHGGMKLWAKGKPVSPELQQRLLQRKLIRPLETALSVEQAVSLTEVVDACMVQMDEVPLVRCFAGTQDALALLRSLRRVQLPQPVRLLLTAIREHDPDEYRSNLNCVLVAVGIASRLDVSDHDGTILMLSALLHDFGLLYINPDFASGQRVLNLSEWKCLASHPVIGQMIVRHLTSLPPLVGDCVASHHERLDGSGYPNFSDSTRIHRLGAWLAVADAVSAIIARGGDDMPGRISVALRMVPEEFDREAVSVIVRSLRDCADCAGATFDDHPAYGRALEAMARLDHALQLIRKQRGQFRELAALRILESLESRLGNIVKALRATGILDVLVHLDGQLDDPELQAEARQIACEVEWRLRSLARSAYVRAETLGALLQGLQETLDVLDGKAAVPGDGADGLHAVMSELPKAA